MSELVAHYKGFVKIKSIQQGDGSVVFQFDYEALTSSSEYREKYYEWFAYIVAKYHRHHLIMNFANLNTENLVAAFFSGATKRQTKFMKKQRKPMAANTLDVMVYLPKAKDAYNKMLHHIQQQEVVVPTYVYDSISKKCVFSAAPKK